MFSGLLVAAIGAAVAVGPVSVNGWNSAPVTVEPGQRIVDQVRLHPGVRRPVVLQVRQAGAPGWSQAWRASSTSRGRLTVLFPTQPAGSFDYRLAVRLGGGRKVTTAVRHVFVRVPVPLAPESPSPAPTSPSASPPVPSPPAPTTIYVAGDIGLCPPAGTPDKTAAQVDAPVIVPGDLAYQSGTASDFANCYDPYWGRLRDSTFPVPGNHEYYSGATAYFAYFGDRVGTLARPWYAVDMGSWRFYMLNSNCGAVGGCGVDSAQYAWLEGQLDVQQSRCTAVVWHHPRWSSGQHGPYSGVGPLYSLLADHGADLLLTGHEHNYERFASMSAAGTVDASGIRQFVVGTGGQTMRSFATTATGSQSRLNDSTGVLRMRLSEDRYSWEFLPTTPGAGTDTGSDMCH